jgi:hypothetical protein
MVAVATVMHEHVHQQASEQRQPDQKTEHVRPVLGEQQRAGDDQESDQNPRQGIRVNG